MEVEHMNDEWDRRTVNGNRKGRTWQICGKKQDFFSKLNLRFLARQLVVWKKAHCIWLPPEEQLKQKKWMKLLSENIKKKNERIINKSVGTITKKSSGWGTENLRNTGKVKKGVTFLLRKQQQLNWMDIFFEKMYLGL